MKTMLAAMALFALSGCVMLTDTYKTMTPETMGERIDVVHDDVEGVTRASSQKVLPVYEVGSTVKDVYVVATTRRDGFGIVVSAETNDPFIPVEGFIGLGIVAENARATSHDVRCGMSVCFHQTEMISSFDKDAASALLAGGIEWTSVRFVASSGARITANIRTMEIVATLNAIGESHSGEASTH